MPKKTVKVNSQDKVVDDVGSHVAIGRAGHDSGRSERSDGQRSWCRSTCRCCRTIWPSKPNYWRPTTRPSRATAFTPARRLPAIAADTASRRAAAGRVRRSARIRRQPDLGRRSGQLVDRRKSISGTAAVKITPDQKYNESLPGLAVKIREKFPDRANIAICNSPGERPVAKTSACNSATTASLVRPRARPPNSATMRVPVRSAIGASIQVGPAMPSAFTVVTRDLFFDFGEFTLNGPGLRLYRRRVRPVRSHLSGQDAGGFRAGQTVTT